MISMTAFPATGQNQPLQVILIPICWYVEGFLRVVPKEWGDISNETGIF
jgi:hypothetical protein